MSVRFILVNGKLKDHEGGEEENGANIEREQVHIQVEAVVKVRDLRDRLYKEVYTHKNSKRNISREDLKETDFIFKCEMGDDKKLKAVRISKQDVLNMEEVDLHSMVGVLWRDPHHRVREITFGVSTTYDPTTAAQNAIYCGYVGDCSILDYVDPTFTAVKDDHVVFPIFALNIKSATGLKQYRRQRDGCPGSFKSKNTERWFDNIAPQLNQIIDDKIAGLISTVEMEKEEELVVTIVPKQNKKSEDSTPKRFRCQVAGCPYIATYEYLLPSHMISHSEDRPFKCPGCPKKFKRQSHMVRHKPACTGHTGRRVGQVSVGPRIRERFSAITSPPQTPTWSSVSLPRKLPLSDQTNVCLKRAKIVTIDMMTREIEDLKRDKSASNVTIDMMTREIEDLKRDKSASNVTIDMMTREIEDLKREKVQLKRERAKALKKNSIYE
ncbi:uncharacterized protein LOC110845441 isoform X2 [Folsomia candida]|uniref:uncharacterized protein LOC110845441 isoform X2 n=1 Tax=Folsomia candida TaxID=158441 RepID=UPI001604C693|nr:uncharacterized protein LOC110845441 isoform X2 [Folsomia candida]